MTEEQTQEQPQNETTAPIFKHVRLVGLKKMATTINLMDERTCGKCHRIFYMGHTGRGRQWIKVVQERPGSFQRHRYLCSSV